jgi:hypothetical protein
MQKIETESEIDEFITVKIRARPYNGFEYKIPKDNFSRMSSVEIIQEVKTYMKNFFTNPHNLPFLREGVDKLDLHFHDDIPYNRPIVYLCDDSHGGGISAPSDGLY